MDGRHLPIGLALVAFVPGSRRHRRLAPALIGLGGLGLISLAAFAGPDECCPTPCGDATTSAESAAMMPTTPGAAPYISACCDTMPATAPITNEPGQSCAATCCTTDDRMTTVVAGKAIDTMLVGPEPSGEDLSHAPETTAASSNTLTVAKRPTVNDGSSCTVGCCPEADGTILMAGSGDFMSMFWLLMTPFGGVVLVVAHLTNHRLTGRCKAGSCNPARDAPAGA